MPPPAKDYWKLFRPAACTLDLAGTTKEAVFDEIVTHLVGARLLGPELRQGALEALLEREKLASTGVGASVAIPHVKLRGIDEALCSLAVHRAGVAWSSIDGAPVTILFTVLRPERASARWDPERHLDMMRWVSQLGREADFRRFALRVTKKSELVALLKEMGATAR
jgi:PTS system fructose-specific IIC component